MNALRVMVILTVAALAHIPSASAGLILSIDDVSLPAGGTGFVDVSIRSNTDDLINLFLFELRIVPIGAPSGELAFTSPQPDPQLTDPDYIFSGDSLKEGGIPVGSVGQTVFPDDTFSGEDLTASAADVTVGATDRLLLRVQVTAATALPPAPGDQFMIVLADVNTLFLNSDFTPIPFESTPGVVTIAAPAAVPEPASISLLCLGALSLAAARRRSAQCL